MMDFLYENGPNDIAAFGLNWCGPEKMPHGVMTEVARYRPESEDGQEVLVLCAAWPARFYTLRVGEAYEITTGSGMREWAATTAAAIASGMVRFTP